jgi:alkylation response protein AidB-like acyl-CoA dehydrogenase
VTTAGFAEFHDELRSVAADVLAKDGSLSWPVLVGTGWAGLEIPEEFGGAGATFAEAAVICEEIGRAAGTTGYLGGAVLAVGALNALSPSDTRDELYSGIASGDIRVALALDGFRLTDGRLEGHAQFVPDAADADRILVVANGADGLPVVVDTQGLDVTALPVIDETRLVATVRADGQSVTNSAVLRFDGDASARLRALNDRAALAVACDSLGLGEAMLAATVSYARVRHQFGRPIGSFQAVKHACADMAVRLAVSRRLVEAAVQDVTAGADAGVSASMAKAHTGTAAVEIAGKAMQLHGGIGYTWESGIHVYLKRAAFNRSLFGSPAAHRQRLALRYSTQQSRLSRSY